MKKKINKEQAKILKELEKIVGKSIPFVEVIELERLGVKIESESVVGLSLYSCGLSTFPDPIEKLAFLKELNLI